MQLHNMFLLLQEVHQPLQEETQSLHGTHLLPDEGGCYHTNPFNREDNIL